MDTTGSEYWNSDRATFEDELDAFRERTAWQPIAAPAGGARRAAVLTPRPSPRLTVGRTAPRLRARTTHRIVRTALRS